MRRPVALLTLVVPLACGSGVAFADALECTTPFAAPSIAPSLPADNPGISLQGDVNCYAWQSFIALNWPADADTRGEPDMSVTKEQFGDPDDLSPPVWGTYKQPYEVFVASGSPGQWNDDQPLPPACAELAGTLEDQLLLRMAAKYSTEQVLNEILEAGSHAWLTAQNRTRVRYEIRLNRDEFEYITENRLYRADCQNSHASTEGLSLPDGIDDRYGKQGAIEVKAAWMELGESERDQWHRFKRVRALIQDAPQQCRAATMGLVGLHIVHKTASFPQMVWATFEHVDNAPSFADKELQSRYSFFDTQCPDVAAGNICPPSDDPACQCNRAPAPDDPHERPVQVARINQISPHVQALNQAIQGRIRTANPDSVWQYYGLVDVAWPKDSDRVARPGATTPLYMGAPSSNALKVANVTMETYRQYNNCLDCHQFAQIADAETPGNESRLASNFSFLFDDATQGKGSPGSQGQCAE